MGDHVLQVAGRSDGSAVHFGNDVAFFDSCFFGCGVLVDVADIRAGRNAVVMSVVIGNCHTGDAEVCISVTFFDRIVFFAVLVFILILVALFGLGYSNLFSIVFSTSMLRVPEKTNEVSSLLIVGVCGGGVITPLLGVITDASGQQAPAIIALAAAWLFMVILIPFIRKARSNS